MVGYMFVLGTPVCRLCGRYLALLGKPIRITLPCKGKTHHVQFLTKFNFTGEHILCLTSVNHFKIIVETCFCAYILKILICNA